MKLVFVVVKVKGFFRTLDVFDQPFITDGSNPDKIGMYLITLKAILLSQPCCLFKEPIVLAQSYHHTPSSKLFLSVNFLFSLSICRQDIIIFFDKIF